MKWSILALCLFFASCGSSGNPGANDNPRITRTYFQGYSMPSAWYKHPELPVLLAQANLNITEIEWVTKEAMAPCPHGAPRPTDWFATRPEDAHLFVSNARKNGVTTFINIVNANNCAATAQGDAWFMEQLQIVLALGLDHVLISPVSEPWASPAKAAHWIALAKPHIPFDHLVLPHGFSGGAFTDEHYCNDVELMHALSQQNLSVLHNTDCSPILNPGPQRATLFADAARAQQNPLLIYDFYAEQPDQTVINVLQ